jgi:hypothetical protein
MLQEFRLSTLRCVTLLFSLSSEIKNLGLTWTPADPYFIIPTTTLPQIAVYYCLNEEFLFRLSWGHLQYSHWLNKSFYPNDEIIILFVKWQPSIDHYVTRIRTSMYWKGAINSSHALSPPCEVHNLFHL